MPTSESTYSSWVGLIYVFNLILGTGALTLPGVFATGGWLLSTIVLLLFSTSAFITVTYIIESIACANATTQWKRVNSHKVDEESEDVIIESDGETNEHTAIVQSIRNRTKYYTLNDTMPISKMVNLYFTKWGAILFYASLCIYLYGDLAIYLEVIAESVTTLICPVKNITNDVQLKAQGSDNYDESCWEDSAITRLQVYKLNVLIFFFVLSPFAYFNMQKTKYIQMFTTFLRWTAFSTMIILAIIQMLKEGPQQHTKIFEMSGISTVMGACVYSFMCHHSLPNIITPLSNKERIVRLLFLDYVLICIFYILLSFTAVYAFKDIEDIYTLNFAPTSEQGILMKSISYFLNLYPVFALSTSYPIIAVTLQTNLKNQILDENLINGYSFILRKLTFPTLAVLPPLVLVFFLHNVTTLVKITCGYGGVFVQFFLPTFLVIAARKQCQADLGNAHNLYASKFRSKFWAVFVIAVGISCMVFISINFVIPKF